MKDQHNRKIDYMRVSITDRCNLRCKYCMPDGIECVSMDRVMTYEEILTVVRTAAELGITKVKITGGEPFARKDCCKLIRAIKETPGIEKVTLTTNGILLREHIDELKEIGIDGINISLDTLSEERFKAITGTDGLNEVLAAVDASLASGIKTKINAVSLCFEEGTLKELQQGRLPEDIERLLFLAKEKNVDVRFIEMMPIGHGRDFPSVPHDLLLTALRTAFPEMTEDNTVHGNGPAEYYRIPGFAGGIGLISAVHGKFCHSCNRVRLTAKGYLKACLCYEDGVELLPILRQAEDDKNEKLITAMEQVIRNKPEQHCFENPDKITESEEMVSIGG